MVWPFIRRTGSPAGETVDVRELDGEAFVAFDGELSIRRAIDRCLRHHDVNVEVVLEFDNIENIKRAVEIPAGVSMLPEPSAAPRGAGRARSSRVRIEGQDPKYQLNRPAGNHPPPQRQPRPDGRAIPGTADGNGGRRAAARALPSPASHRRPPRPLEPAGSHRGRTCPEPVERSRCREAVQANEPMAGTDGPA